MLKTMKSEMLTITKKKSRQFCFTRIFTNFNYRRDNPTKYKALEGRFLGNSPASPISIASSPPASPKNCNMPSNPPLPIYSPSSPSDVSSNTALQISVPELNSISNLPTPDHNLTPSRNTTVPQTTPAQNLWAVSTQGGAKRSLRTRGFSSCGPFTNLDDC